MNRTPGAHHGEDVEARRRRHGGMTAEVLYPQNYGERVYKNGAHESGPRKKQKHVHARTRQDFHNVKRRKHVRCLSCPASMYTDMWFGGSSTFLFEVHPIAASWHGAKSHHPYYLACVLRCRPLHLHSTASSGTMEINRPARSSPSL